MKQIYPFIALAVLLAGGVFLVSNFQFTNDGPGGPQLRPRDNPSANPGGFSLPFGLGQKDPSSTSPATTFQPPVNIPVSAPGRQALGGDMIRIATFNIQVFGESKLARPEVVEVLANIVRNFDIVAVQEIRDEQQNLVPRFLSAVNAPGLRYDYVVGPRLGRSMSKEQYAYLFNTDTIEVDRRAMYTVADPDDLLHREPLVASFRCRRVEPSLAFTFTLINMHTDPTPQTLTGELAVLDDVLLSVRNDGRGEDDVLLLGDFNANFRQMTELSRVPNVYFAVSANSATGALLATNTAGKAQYDNIIFDRTATQEFLGRSGVFDFLRQYNLSLDQAKLVSDHFPVWAEFSVYEGGVPGRVARRSSYGAQPSYEPSLGQRPNTWTSAPAYSDNQPGRVRNGYEGDYAGYGSSRNDAPQYDQPYPARGDYADRYTSPRESRFDPYAQPDDRGYRSRMAPEYTADPRYPGASYDSYSYPSYSRDRR